MGNTVNGDMQDSVGGFNLGRPSGYVEDFNALPEATKDIMRSVKRVKLFMGLLTINEPMDKTGAAISTLTPKYDNLAFVMDVKNRDSMKSLEGALAILGRRNLLPIMSTLNLTGKEESIPTGATYGVITAAVGEQVELSNRSMSTEDAELVGSIIDVDAD